MAAPSKEHILREIRRVAEENGGRPLGKERFADATGIREGQWSGKYWALWSDAVREAGYEPSAWTIKALSDDQLLEALAFATRDLGRFPTVSELKLRRRVVPDLPAVNVLRGRLGGHAEQIRRLVAFADTTEGFGDVAAICAPLLDHHPRGPKVPHPAAVVTGVVYLIQMGEFHKIGRSNDPGRRLYEVGLHLPIRAEVSFNLPDNFNDHHGHRNVVEISDTADA